MTEEDRNKYINMRSDKGDDQEITEEVRESFAQDQQLDHGSDLLKRKRQEHTDDASDLSAGDVESTWDDADDEAEGGGSTSTPDENVIDDVGGAVGISYSDSEPLHTGEKMEQREHDRWELNPASDPDFQERIKTEFREPRAPKERRHN